MDNLSKILDAASFAAKKHKDQKRKGSDGEPYINHPIEVANLLTNVGGVNDPDMIIAALLHDTVEDCGVSFEEIEEKFGTVVADYVRELTDDKSLPKAERKQLQIEHAPHLSHGQHAGPQRPQARQPAQPRQHPPPDLLSSEA